MWVVDTSEATVEELVGERRGHQLDLGPAADVRDDLLQCLPQALRPFLLQRLKQGLKNKQNKSGQCWRGFVRALSGRAGL